MRIEKKGLGNIFVPDGKRLALGAFQFAADYAGDVMAVTLITLELPKLWPRLERYRIATGCSMTASTSGVSEP